MRNPLTKTWRELFGRPFQPKGHRLPFEVDGPLSTTPRQPAKPQQKAA